MACRSAGVIANAPRCFMPKPSSVMKSRPGNKILRRQAWQIGRSHGNGSSKSDRSGAGPVPAGNGRNPRLNPVRSRDHPVTGSGSSESERLVRMAFAYRARVERAGRPASNLVPDAARGSIASGRAGVPESAILAKLGLQTINLSQPGGWRSSNMVRELGGAEGDRTPDLVIANDALSQLSYCPAPARYLGQIGGGVKKPLAIHRGFRGT